MSCDVTSAPVFQRMDTMGENMEQSNLYLKLFKLVFGSVTLFAQENELMLKVKGHYLLVPHVLYVRMAVLWWLTSKCDAHFVFELKPCIGKRLCNLKASFFF